MEFAEVKQEVISDDDETMKNEDCIRVPHFDEVYIKEECDENNSIHLPTGSGIEVQHSVPTVCDNVFGNHFLAIGQEAHIRKEPLNAFQNIPEHSNQKLHSSNICNDYPVMTNNLIQNTIIHAIENPYMSQATCYDNKADVVRKSATDISERPFECCKCEYKSARKSDLARHMRTHNDERPFACDVCEYKSTRKADLARHMKTHNAERPFACFVCKYRSAQKADLIIHVRSHTGERPFACDVCKYKSARKADVVRHNMRAHNGENGLVGKYKSILKKALVANMRTYSGKRS